MNKVLVLLVCLVGVGRGHLLPQALEDVHAFVQSELQQRSQGQLGIEAPPSGGPMFQTTQTQTYIGVPVVLQNGVKFDGEGRIQKPAVAEDLSTAQSQNIVAPVKFHRPTQVGQDLLPRGLIPPGPMEQHQQNQAASNEQAQVIPASLVGPSTFVSEATRENRDTNNREVRVPPQLLNPIINSNNGGGQGQDRGRMEGWVPLDKDGSKLARGLGVKLQVREDNDNIQGAQVQAQAQSQVQDQVQEPAYRGTGYSIRQQEAPKEGSDDGILNELEILPTNSVQLTDIVIGKNGQQLKEAKGRFPVYTRGRNPKVVIHAQNVIIRGDGSETEVKTENGTTITPTVKQFPAYSAVPQLNNFLRDQLRIAALNQLMQHQLQQQQQEHPLNNQPFPRPLSLRQIALAVRSGQFPEPPQQDPLLPQSSQLQVNIPHMVNLNPDAASSIQAQTKLPFPGGLGLGNLYRNMFQQGGGAPQQGFDPREPLEYSMLAQLSGQNLKGPSVPTFKARPQASHDYGESVAYTTGKDGQDPIQIVPTGPIQEQQPPGAGLNTGSLKGVSEQLLKQMILQELQEIQDTPNILLPQGLSNPNPARLPLRHLRPSFGRQPSYGTNAHPFAYLAEDGGGNGGGIQDSTGGVPDAVFEETYEYSLPPGMSVEDIMNDDGKMYRGKKRPSHHHYSSPGYPGGYPGAGSGPSDITPGSDGSLPINTDTMMQLGKGLFYQALEFSRNHNPMTLFSKIRSLPPVKVDLYKVPMGIPDNFMEKLPAKWRSDGGESRPPRGGGGGGPGSGPRQSRGGRGDKRGRRKNLPRKNRSRNRN